MSASLRAAASLRGELARIVGAEHVSVPSALDLSDATEARGLRGRADAVVRPADTEQVRAIVAWCYAHDVPITPRGGGTGYAGGAVPTGGVVLALGRLDRVRSFDALLWRMEVEAGVTTQRVRRLARESGLLFPPDPGAAEQSQIGGNAATNAGGPHAFKYGVTGRWVTGLEAVVAPGEVLRVGGPVRKDVAGYDLRGLLVGSEGTLGVITALWLRLMPAPEAARPVVAVVSDARDGQASVEAALASGAEPSALEYLDAATVAIARRTFPGPLPPDGGFMLIAEADGSVAEAERGRALLADALAGPARTLWSPAAGAETEALWRWRDGVSLAVTAHLGGKASEDIVVPVDRLAEAVEETQGIGRRHGLEACSWGHAGDGNLHSSFLFERGDEAAMRRVREAADELFALAAGLGGSISGEHGVGLVKAGQRDLLADAAAVRLGRAVKHALDPKGLFNPGKKDA